MHTESPAPVSTVKLPVEIIGLIIDMLGSGDVADLQSIQACALICKAILPFCRSHIFTSVSLVSASDFLMFFNTLDRSPGIATCVRHLDLGKKVFVYDYETESETVDPESFSHFAQMIDTFTVLESVEILQIEYETTKIFWDEIQPEMQNIVLKLIQSPTLISLTLRKLGAIPLTCFVGLSDKLRHLHLHSVTIASADGHLELVPANTIYLEKYSINQKSVLATDALLEATYSSGVPIFHFGHLEHLRIHCKRDITDESFLYRLLEAAGQLSTLELEGDSVRTLVKTSRLISAWHKIPQRMVLCFSDVFSSGTIVEAVQALGGIVLAAVEELLICVKGWGWALGEIDNCSMTGERLDELFTNAEAWPQLKTLKLIMNTTAWNRIRGDDDSLEDVRTLSQSFVRAHFPILSSSNNISFSIATNVGDYVSEPAHLDDTVPYSVESGYQNMSE